MLSSTVYQGKSAASWNTTARRGTGWLTGTQRKSTSPRVGASKPATMFNSVDLPQPDGPRTAVNSSGAIARAMPSRATSRPTRPLNSLKTHRRSTTGSGMPLERAPAQHHLGGAEDDLIGDETQEAHREHGGHADVHPADVVRVPEHVAEARLHRDHLRDDDRGPRPPDAEPQPGEDGRQGRRQHDLQEDGPLARPQHARSPQEQEIRVAHPVGGVDCDGVEGPEADQEQGARVVDAEDRDGERQPGGDGDRPEELDRGIDD